MSASGLRFIDLFAGLGGFSLALGRFGHKAVFASEIDPELQGLYEANFGLKPAGDIRTVPVSAIPPHDILCAGFPCQPFSKAGEQQGFDCPRWGDLFDYAFQALVVHSPHYFILENVPNLERHDGGRTWATINTRLRDAGYDVRSAKLSPHKFGIPQIRERIYLVGSRNSMDGFNWPAPSAFPIQSIRSVLDEFPQDARPISQQVTDCLNVWQSFVELFPPETELPSFPIWSMEFGADYPYAVESPWAIGAGGLGGFKGSHGSPLSALDEESRFLGLPSYARTTEERFPAWKSKFIQQNRALYQDNSAWIEDWLPSVLRFPPSLQKFEWNCKGEERNLWEFIIQFRASGVRVKRPTTAPSLVAMTTTQVPIVAWERRYMTPLECARLQSMDHLDYLPAKPTAAYKALGNAVNVDVVELIAHALLDDGTH